MGRKFLFGCVLVFLFSTQNQVPQIIIEMGQKINHYKVVLVVFQTIFKNFQFFHFQKCRYTFYREK